MNIILLSETDFISPDCVRLKDRRFEHIRDVHRAKIGDELRTGLINGKMGTGTISDLSEDFVELRVTHDLSPPAPLPLTLFLALPRPKFLKRILQTVSSLGVKKIYLFNSYRVEKIYWSAKQLEPVEIRAACLLGLEQARDTVLPEVIFRRLFKPFVEDECPELLRGTRALLAHPGAAEVCPRGVEEQVSLFVGPEGGFIEYEIAKLEAAGCTTVRMFERILKVETAVSSLIGRVM